MNAPNAALHRGVDPNHCDSCGADIFWAITLSHSREPIDLVPDPEKGSIVVMDNGDVKLALHLSTKLPRTAREGAARHGVELYTSHFATCPNAGAHRKS